MSLGPPRQHTFVADKASYKVHDLLIGTLDAIGLVSVLADKEVALDPAAAQGECLQLLRQVTSRKEAHAHPS